MRALLWNLFLALVWVAATGEFNFLNLATGFGLGFLILFFTRRVIGSPGYFRKIRTGTGLLLFLIEELIRANLRVAYEVITPGKSFRPGIIAVPLEARSDLEITLLSNLITLTPGSLSLDVSPERDRLYVYVMYLDDVEAVRRRIKEGYEQRVLALLE